MEAAPSPSDADTENPLHHNQCEETLIFDEEQRDAAMSAWGYSYNSYDEEEQFETQFNLLGRNHWTYRGLYAALVASLLALTLTTPG